MSTATAANTGRPEPTEGLPFSAPTPERPPLAAARRGPPVVRRPRAWHLPPALASLVGLVLLLAVVAGILLATLVLFGGLFPIVGAMVSGAVAVLVSLADGGATLAPAAPAQAEASNICARPARPPPPSPDPHPGATSR